MAAQKAPGLWRASSHVELLVCGIEMNSRGYIKQITVAVFFTDQAIETIEMNCEVNHRSISNATKTVQACCLSVVIFCYLLELAPCTGPKS